MRAAWLLLLLIPSAPAHAAETGERFTISEVDFSMPSDAVVGPKRSGMLCTPAGRLRWRDVDPERKALIQRLAVAARDAGLDVRVPSADDFSSAISTPYRVTVAVTRVEASVCVPWQGLRLGKQPRIRGERHLETVWRVFDQKRRVLVAKLSLCRSGRYAGETRDLSEPVSGALAELATAFVRQLDTAALADAAPVAPDSGEETCIDVRG